MVNLIKLQCPNCSANLEVDSKLKQCFCQYCGTKLLINNENEKTIHIVNEADIARAENEYRLLKSHMENNADLARAELSKRQFELEKQKARELSKKAITCTIWTIVFAFGIMISIEQGGSGGQRGMFIAIAQIAFTWLSFVLLNSQKQTAGKTALAYLMKIAAIALILIFIIVVQM